MKIALVRTASNILRYGGYNIQEIGLAKALLAYGVSTDVYARFSNVETLTEIVCADGARVEIHPLKGKQIYREIMYYPSLKDDLCNGGYDIVQLLDDSQMMLPMLFKSLKSRGVKTILWQGMYRNFPAKPARMMQIVYDMLCAGIINRNTDLKIAKTEAAKRYLEGKEYENIITVPVGLDEVVYEENEVFEQEMNDFKNRFPHLLLYIGAIEPRRNPDFLIRLLESLDDEKVGLVIIGKGVLTNDLRTLIERSKKKGCIRYYEQINNKNLISVYSRANVFLLPTNYEIYGMVVMEALYAGIPVVSTPEAGPAFILSNERLGRCLPLNIEKWKNAIYFYLTQHKSADDIAYRQQYIDECFRWPRIAKQYYEILYRLF